MFAIFLDITYNQLDMVFGFVQISGIEPPYETLPIRDHALGMIHHIDLAGMRRECDEMPIYRKMGSFQLASVLKTVLGKKALKKQKNTVTDSAKVKENDLNPDTLALE